MPSPPLGCETEPVVLTDHPGRRRVVRGGDMVVKVFAPGEAMAHQRGEPVDLDNLAGAAAALWDAWEYRVLLVRAGSRARRSKAVGDG